MTVREIMVTNRLGLHARPAAMIVIVAEKFKSEIKLKKKGTDFEVNGKSVLGVMALAAEMGSTVIITAQGEDEERATQQIAQLFIDKFGET